MSLWALNPGDWGGSDSDHSSRACQILDVSTSLRSVAIDELLCRAICTLSALGSLWFATDQGLPADTDGSALPITVADCRPGDAEDGMGDG